MEDLENFPTFPPKIHRLNIYMTIWKRELEAYIECDSLVMLHKNSLVGKSFFKNIRIFFGNISYQICLFKRKIEPTKDVKKMTNNLSRISQNKNKIS